MGADHQIISKGLTLTPQASDPADATEGDIYYNSVLNQFRLYNGSLWSNLTDIGRYLSYTSKTTTATTSAGDNVVMFDMSGSGNASYTVTLHSAVGNGGQQLMLLITAGTGTLTLDTSSAQTIGGYASGALAMKGTNQFLILTSDNVNWQITSRNFGLTTDNLDPAAGIKGTQIAAATLHGSNIAASTIDVSNLNFTPGSGSVTSVTVAAGTGLTGGGTVTTSGTITLNMNTSAGGVGTYAFALYNNFSGGTVGFGGAVSGGSLLVIGHAVMNGSPYLDYNGWNYASGALSGTWQCMGYAQGIPFNGLGCCSAPLASMTLWQRIA